MEDIRMETYHYEPRVKPVEKKGIKRVAAYCRVSTMEEEQELSFNTQRSYYEELISKAPDMELVGIYGDQGFSGLDAKKRKEFQRMIYPALRGNTLIIIRKQTHFGVFILFPVNPVRQGSGQRTVMVMVSVGSSSSGTVNV